MLSVNNRTGASLVLDFEAELIRPEGTGTWTFVTVPFQVEEVFGSKAQVKVRGTINGIAYKGSLMPHGDGKHYMVVNKSLRDEAEASAGIRVKVTLERDTEIREVRAPEDFLFELEANEEAKAYYNNLAYSFRKSMSCGLRQLKNRKLERIE